MNKVAVVIPAYNAARTLTETVESVARQTHSALEIVIVDDGSTDSTLKLARSLAERDARIKVLAKSNGGVASARNLGAASTTAPFIAPVDADDIWHPAKIERQLLALSRAEPLASFCYCGFRFIDLESRVLQTAPYYDIQGWGSLRHLAHNFVGTGSAPLIRRGAFEQVGGYDASLREDGVEGCEDFLIQARLAEVGPIAGVPEWLVGYRVGGASMSSNIERMLRSKVEALVRLRAAAPDLPQSPYLAASGFFQIRNGLRMMGRGTVPAGARFVRNGFAITPGAQQAILAQLLAGWSLGVARQALGKLAPPRALRPFDSFAPADPDGAAKDLLLDRLIQRLEPVDRARGLAKNPAP